MIINVKRKWYVGEELAIEDDNDFDLAGRGSWYTAQTYFDEGLKHFIVDGVYTKIVLEWRGKVYEFKRKENDDQRHKEGWKKRAPRHNKTA